MKRGYDLIMKFILFIVAWTWLVTGNMIKDDCIYNMVLASPLILLIAFGLFALYSIGKELYILKDFPEEHKKLLMEVKDVR